MLLNAAGAFAQGGTTGPLTWQLTGTHPNYTLTISGVGAMPDYEKYQGMPWYAWKNYITTVVIGNGVTTIGGAAFYSCTALASITIPNSVTTIGDWAFYSCTALASITIPSSVTTIGDEAFSGCTALESITLSNGVTTIGDRAFGWCTALESVTIPNSVTTIGNYAFSDCHALASVTIPNNVTTIGDYAFYYCYALESVTIPNSVTTIGDGAFAGCIALESIIVESGNPNYSSTDGILFNQDKTVLVCYPAGKKWNSYVIPNSVTTIGYGAFAGCTTLASVTIPNSVTTIGDEAFVYCTALKSITIPNSVTTIGDGAFSGCTALASITFSTPSSVTTIGNDAFFLCALKSITIPNSVTTIGKHAFNSCYALESVTIPNSVTTIGDGAFNCCFALESITIPNGVTTIGDGAFAYCTALESVTIPNSVTTIGNGAFWSCTALASITNLNPVPVEIQPDVFENIDKSACTLNVPTNAISAYQKAEVWQEFNIVVGGFLVNPKANNSEYGYTTGDGLYEANATATVTATAYDGYKFVNWTKYDVVVSTANSYSFVVTEDVELVANFEKDVGIVETQCIASLQVYPNPTTGLLTICDNRISEIGQSEIVIYDVLGRTVGATLAVAPNGTHQSPIAHRPSHIETCTSQIEIDISHLPQGVYGVRVISEGRVVGNGKVVKM